MFEITIDDNLYPIEETEECYVSHWSKFFISVMPPKLNNMAVCDFGAGTGIFSIKSVFSGAKYVTAIEKDSKTRELLLNNIKKNGLTSKIKIIKSSNEIEGSEIYDYIFCNPACYPSEVGNSSFFHAGEQGMDMIIEVFKFASRALKNNGHLLILVPSVSPRSLAFDMLEDLGMYARPAKDTLVPFREHLSSKLKNWVDNNVKKYPEMKYYEIEGKLYEKVHLHSVHFLSNMKQYKEEERFFDGFIYTIETLPNNVISCLDAATAKMIPLENELKSLVLKTEKGLYVLSLKGCDFANFRAVKKYLNVKEACMASEEELKSLGLRKGAVCPVLKDIWDMPQLISKEILDLPYVSTNAGKLNECITFNPWELLRKDKKPFVGEFAKSTRSFVKNE